jgi:hypothetical protein
VPCPICLTLHVMCQVTELQFFSNNDSLVIYTVILTDAKFRPPAKRPIYSPLGFALSSSMNIMLNLYDFI